MTSDAELLAAHRACDREAFGTLFARHRDRLWAIALRTTGHPEDAADALQDAIVAAFTRADSFRGEAQVTTWLHRIVVNACLDRIRRNAVRRAEPLEAVGRPGDRPGDRPGEDDTVREAEAAVRRHDLLAALRQISPEQRVALVLVDIEGYSMAEAAAALEVPAGTVKSRCSRGRARLAELLRGTDADPDASQTPSTKEGGPM